MSGRAQVFNHRVGSQAGDFSANVANRSVHGIGKSISGIATNDQRSLLAHESGHVAAVSADEHQAAFHGDSRASRRIAMNDHRASANRRARAISSASMHDGRSIQHGFGQTPAGAALGLPPWNRPPEPPQ